MSVEIEDDVRVLWVLRNICRCGTYPRIRAAIKDAYVRLTTPEVVPAAVPAVVVAAVAIRSVARVAAQTDDGG